MSAENRSPHQSLEHVSRLYKHKVTMLIDDNYIDNFISEKIIAACSFSKETHTAINGSVALDLLQQWFQNAGDSEPVFPDVIFLDLNMPVMNGLEFIREFKKLDNANLENCQLIVLTSSIHEDDKAEVQKIDDTILFLSKPLTVDVLLTL
jgi:CheY-like chemotaxis protein